MQRAFGWQTADPEARGLAGDRIGAWAADLADRGTHGLLLIRHDRIVHEWYAPGYGPDRPHFTASLAKALVGGMSLLAAAGDGRLHPDDAAWRYISAWQNDPERSRITIRHLATHSSGIEDAETPDKGHFDQGGWKEGFWRREPDPFTISRDQAPLVFEPGTQYAYSNPGMALLAYAVTASLAGGQEPARQTDIRTLLAERVLAPIGVREEEWSIGYGSASEVEGLSLWANWGGAEFTPRAAARIGRLMMHRGEWQGRQVLPAAWVDRALAPQGTPGPSRLGGSPDPHSGLAWWLNHDGAWPSVPRDAFAGAGAQHQVLLVVPSLDLILVRNGEVLSKGGETFWEAVYRHLLAPLMAAVDDLDIRTGTPQAPYRPSPSIHRVRFSPVEQIHRHGIDSDNWPVTWGADDLVYTAYGDGWGFEPRTEHKLSLGLGTIAGTPPDLRCRNLRSETGERQGDGADGLKASGLLMVGGALYMLARNAGNAQLAWSEDRGVTWTWADWRFTESFGCPTFLNYGRNYAGAREEYVYVYSQDGPSAYVPYDGIVLARVPVGRIRERAAYTFYAGRGGNQQPLWSADVAERKEVFRYLGRCQRLDVIHYPVPGRYLMALGYNHRGGWGIYDAPAPWGPWTCAYHTHYWGLGNTHYYRLPTRWIGAGHHSMHMIFSGRTYDSVVYDALCVRRLEFDWRADEPAHDGTATEGEPSAA